LKKDIELMGKIDFSEHRVRFAEELRELVGTPHEAVVKKSIQLIDDHARNFIAKSSLLFLASSNEKGQCDVSPRGDAPGFAYVANEKQLIIPERPGNRRADSLLNILLNPHVGLIFIIPGMQEVLRVNGRAVIIKEHVVLQELQLNEKTPVIGIAVEVEECYIHCPRALKSSSIWDANTWPPVESHPSVQEMFQAHLKINGYSSI
jgi:PPOX class probable FMN-dependent enzyme